jgi:hypothetical protein
MKNAILFSLVSTGILFAQSLNHDYSMGRIVGGDYKFNTSLAEVDNDVFVFGSAQRYRFGIADRYQWNLDLYGVLQSLPDDLYYGVGAMALSGNYKIEDGHVLDWSLYNRNLAMEGTGHSIISGFNDKFDRKIVLNFNDRFLSQNGYIHLETSELELAFLRGPLLDGGQYRHSLGGGFSANNNANESLNAHYAPEVGIAGFLQLQAAMSLQIDDVTGEPSNSYRPEFGAEFRLPLLWVAGRAYGTDYRAWGDVGESDGYAVDANAGLLLGLRKMQFSEVEGNYDGFFSSQLGAGQIYVQQYFTQEQNSADSHRNYSLTDIAQVGLASWLTVGASYHKVHNADIQDDHSLDVMAQFSNIPLRTEGPYDVADMEYLWGYVVKPGDWRVLARWTTPLLDPDTTAGYMGSLIHRYGGRNGTPAINNYSSAAYAQDSVSAVLEVHALVGLFEDWFAKGSYGYYPNGLYIDGDVELPYWHGDAHASTLAFGYARFNAVCEMGVQWQVGRKEENDNLHNVFPIYFKSMARF